MIILLTILWVVDRYAWNYTKQMGRYEDRQGDLDFIAKYSQAGIGNFCTLMIFIFNHSPKVPSVLDIDIRIENTVQRLNFNQPSKGQK